MDYPSSWRLRRSLHRFTSLIREKYAKIVFTNPAGLLSELKSIETANIIITDIALTSKHKDEILSEFKRLSSKCEIIYLDHHLLPSGLSIEKTTCENG